LGTGPPVLTIRAICLHSVQHAEVIGGTPGRQF
jgi:hypothetical protein